MFVRLLQKQADLPASEWSKNRAIRDRIVSTSTCVVKKCGQILTHFFEFSPRPPLSDRPLDVCRIETPSQRLDSPATNQPYAPPTSFRGPAQIEYVPQV